MSKIALLVLALSSGMRSFSQEAILDSRTVEDSSGYYYDTNQFQELLNLGNKGIKNNIDYYYLRYRMAVAEQVLGKYHRSTENAAMALRESPGDPYLYSLIAFNSYMLGNTEEQHFARVSMGNTFDTTHRYHAFIPVQFIYSEAAVKRSSITSVNNLSFLHVGFQSALSKRFFLYQGYATSAQTVYWGDLKQWEYYGRLTYLLSTQTKMNVGFHYMNTLATINEPPSEKGTESYVFLFSREYTYRNMLIKAGAAYANINNDEIWQEDLSFSYAPFSNAFLSFSCDLQLQSINNATKLFIKPEAGISAFKNTWIGLQYFFVNGYNMIESDAFLVNNSNDKTIDRAQILLNYRLNDHFSFYGLYQHERKVERYYELDYSFDTFLLGLKISR